MPEGSQEWASLGKPCLDDCSGHEAGWMWAEATGQTEFRGSSGRNPSFAEGVQQYIEDQDALAQQEAAEAAGAGVGEAVGGPWGAVAGKELARALFNFRAGGGRVAGK